MSTFQQESSDYQYAYRTDTVGSQGDTREIEEHSTLVPGSGNYHISSAPVGTEPTKIIVTKSLILVVSILFLISFVLGVLSAIPNLISLFTLALGATYIIFTLMSVLRLALYATFASIGIAIFVTSKSKPKLNLRLTIILLILTIFLSLYETVGMIVGYAAARDELGLQIPSITDAETRKVIEQLYNSMAFWVIGGIVSVLLYCACCVAPCFGCIGAHFAFMRKRVLQEY